MTGESKDIYFVSGIVMIIIGVITAGVIIKNILNNLAYPDNKKPVVKYAAISLATILLGVFLIFNSK